MWEDNSVLICKEHVTLSAKFNKKMMGFLGYVARIGLGEKHQGNRSREGCREETTSGSIRVSFWIMSATISFSRRALLRRISYHRRDSNGRFCEHCNEPLDSIKSGSLLTS
jgi:hypothetical protein